MLSDRGSALDQREKGALDAALPETYRRAGIGRDPRTHSRPSPVLRDLHTVLREQGDQYNIADRLERYVDGSLGQVFSSQTSVDLDRPFVVFNVRDLDPDLRPIGIYLIADYIWSQVRRNRRPRMLLIDEAWALMQHEEGAKFLASMARRARKYYLGLTTVTQDVEDFLRAGGTHGLGIAPYRSNAAGQLNERCRLPDFRLSVVTRVVSNVRRARSSSCPGNHIACGRRARWSMRCRRQTGGVGGRGQGARRPGQ